MIRMEWVSWSESVLVSVSVSVTVSASVFGFQSA